jgi:hypothetical protein
LVQAVSDEKAPPGTKCDDAAPPCPDCGSERYWSDYFTDELIPMCVTCISRRQFEESKSRREATKSWRWAMQDPSPQFLNRRREPELSKEQKKKLEEITNNTDYASIERRIMKAIAKDKPQPLPTDIPRDPVPMEFWGRDHWSTFAFICTRIVGEDGKIDRRKMRCDNKRHPLHAHTDIGPGAPTMLRDNVALKDHDDWDCADDAEAANLLVNDKGTGLNRRYALTDAGWAMLRKITEHKAAGGTFSNFDPTK